MKNKIIILLLLANFSGFSQIVRTLPMVNNTSDSLKPVSNAQKTALNLKANSLNAVFTGNVGIGITTPTTTLDVNGGINASTSIYLSGVNFGQPSGLSTNTLNARVIANSTGTGSYADGLYLGFQNIGGSSTKIFDGGGANYLTVGNATLSTNGITKLLFGSQTDDGTINQFAGDVKFKSNASIIGNAIIMGNAGFGTSTPKTKLEIGGILANATLLSAITSSGNLLLSDGGNLGVVYGISNYSSSYQGYVQARNNSASNIAYNYLINPLGGNVGIGTTNPTSTLHNNGSEASSITTISVATTLGDTYYVIANSATTYLITLPSVTTCVGRSYAIKTLTGNKTITAYLNLTGVSTTILTAGTVIYITSDGTNWQQF